MHSPLPRITARVDAATQELLSEAAAIMGMPSINAFVVNTAVERAKEIMQRERILNLSQRDAEQLIEALDSPVKSIQRLNQASINYLSTTNKE